MSLEAFLRANPMTFRLEGRIVYLVDRDGEKWKPPPKEESHGGHGAGAGKGAAEAKAKPRAEVRRKGQKGDGYVAGERKGRGKHARGNGEERQWSEWDDWEWQEEWKAANEVILSLWKAFGKDFN